MSLAELPWLSPSHWLTKWVMLFHYFMMSFNNGALFVSFSAIQEEAQDYYQTTALAIEVFEQSFLLMTIVTLYPVKAKQCVWMVRKSLYWGMFLTIGLTAVGCITKYVAGPSYGLALASVFLVASVNILMLAACLTVPAEWFPPELQVRSTSISGIANIVGMGFGLVVSVHTSIPVYSLIMACISSACFVGFLFTGRISPRKQEFSMTLKETFSIIQNNCRLVAVILLSSTIIGVIYTYIGMLAAILQPEGLSTKDIGVTGGLFVVSGMLGSSCSNWIGETKSIAFSFRTFLVPSMFFTTGLIFSTSSFAAFSILNVLTGFFIQGTMVIALSAISYNSHPADESIVSTIVYVLANLISLACNYIVEAISVVTGLPYLFSLALINAAASVPLMLIYKQVREDYRPLPQKDIEIR